MTRLDLFTAPDCPAARAVVLSFARERPDIVVHEWDLTHDPGPAVGRGIVATPAVLVNLTRILLGVPELRELAEAARARLSLSGWTQWTGRGASRFAEPRRDRDRAPPPRLPHQKRSSTERFEECSYLQHPFIRGNGLQRYSM